MSIKNFNAYSWLTTNTKEVQVEKTSESPLFHKSLADFSLKTTPQNEFNKFFVPGWSGESLVSLESKEFKATLLKVHSDVKNSFLSNSSFTSKLKKSIYEDFLSFAEFKALNFTGIDTAQDFFKEISSPDSIYRKELDLFIDIYTLRTSIVYIFKIRFVSILAKEMNIPFEKKNITYPNSFLTKLFKKGSSLELNAEALNQNLYSWYFPNTNLCEALTSYYNMSDSLAIAEIIKNISTLSEEIISHKAEYSHSISHKQFGLHLNSLLINFPLWLKNFYPKFKNTYKIQNDNLEIISTKYDGDFLESLSVSHWLAQDANKDIKWDQILCPSFHSNTFDKGLFTKVINELQFLTFLTQIAKKQNKEVLHFISNVMKGHFENRKKINSLQKNLFEDLNSNKSQYDRIVLNLLETPKNNSQHYIINSIVKNLDSIKENGFIFVLSSKKIFISSQKTKIESLLKRATLEGLFDFSDIQGKGEVASYIYIFSKNTRVSTNSSKSSFLNFRFNGTLQSFSEFKGVTNLTHNFFLENINEMPALASTSYKQLALEFFQDAIVDGQMIHAAGQDSNKVTHPHFFNNLTKSCTTLGSIFEIQNIKDYSTLLDQNSFSLRNDKSNSSEFILIVDQRSKDKTSIEVINKQLLESKIENYGQSLCSYFEIIPKWHETNTEALKAYFNSAIGAQIIDLTFNNQLNKTKANLSKLLVPKFLTEQKNIPNHIKPALNILNYTKSQILETHPKLLVNQFQQISSLLNDLVKEYPQETIANLAEFDKNICICLELFDSSHKRSIYNFNNPMLKTPLLLAKTSVLYPNNEDIHVDFSHMPSAKAIHLPMTHFKTLSLNHEGYKTHQIDLYSGEDKIISLYSDIEMIKFIEFLIEHVSNVSISDLIQAIKVPELETLKSITESFNQMKDALVNLSEQTSPLLNKLFNKYIAQA